SSFLLLSFSIILPYLIVDLKLCNRTLLCLEAGVKPNTIKPSEYQALELTYGKFVETKKAKTVSSEWLDYLENVNKYGACYIMKKEDNENE
ncbi:hypothetical protein ABI161_14770, partial [Enterococcus faecium]